MLTITVCVSNADADRTCAATAQKIEIARHDGKDKPIFFIYIYFVVCVVVKTGEEVYAVVSF